MLLYRRGDTRTAPGRRRVRRQRSGDGTVRFVGGRKRCSEQPQQVHLEIRRLTADRLRDRSRGAGRRRTRKARTRQTGRERAQEEGSRQAGHNEAHEKKPCKNRTEITKDHRIPAEQLAEAPMKTGMLIVSMMLTAASTTAQPLVPPCNPKPTTYQDHWCRRIQEILDARSGPTGPQAGFREKIQNATEISSRNWTAFLLYAQARSEGLDLRAMEDARIDKQLGAPAAAAGSGSVVSKGSVPSILAFAVENGALTQSTSATTVTLRGNLVGWLDLVKNQGFIASYQDDSRFVRQLRRVSYSATLNTDAGSTTAPASAPSGLAALTPQAIHDQLDKTRQQLAGYSVRVALKDDRDPRTSANRAAIATLLDTKGVALLRSDNAFDAFLSSDEYNRKWSTETVDLLADTGRALTATDIQRILYRRLEDVRLLMIDRVPNFNEQVAKGLLALQAFDKARVGVFQAAPSAVLPGSGRQDRKSTRLNS